MSAEASKDSQDSPSPTPGGPERPKGEVRCVVKLLDGDILQFHVQRKAKAEELIDLVMSRLEVSERDYFGLYYAVREQRFFLDPLKSGARQYPDSRAPQWVLHFGVKYYVPDPHLLKDDFTKYLYCLQLRQDIKERHVLLDPASGPALQLAALTVQGHLGEYDPEQHGEGYTHKYLEFLYGNESDIDPGAEDKVRAVHQEKRDLTPAESDVEFLIIAKDLPRYGKHLFVAKELLDDERYVEIGAGYTGISVYYEKKLATDYPWSVINKLLYHGRRFKIRYHPDDDLERWEIKKHKFDATETKWSKRIWKECVEQHTFFRLAVPGEPPLPTFIPQLGRNSKLRFSGRTLAQMRLHNKPSPGVSFPRPPPLDPKDTEVWTRPRSASPEQGVSAGRYEQRVAVEAEAHSSAIYGHHVAMVSFPYDDTPSPWLQYRIVVRNGHKIFQKELGVPTSAPPTPAYRLRWAYVHNARIDPDCYPEGGVAMLQPLRLEGKRPINVQGAEDYHTSTESLEASATKEFLSSEEPQMPGAPPRLEAEV